MQGARASELADQTSLASLSSRGISRADTDEYLQRLLAGKQQQLRTSNAFYSPFAQSGGQQQVSALDRAYIPRSNSTSAVDHAPSQPAPAARAVRQPAGCFTAQRQPASRPPGGPANGTAASSQTSRDPSAACAVKQLLGKQKFKELRGAVISHQDTFMQQLWDLHRLSRRQEYLMAVCDEPDKLRAETARMQAEPQAAARASQQAPDRQDVRSGPGSRRDPSSTPAPMPSLGHVLNSGHARRDQSDSMARQIQHDQKYGPQHHMRNQPAMHFHPSNYPGASQLRSPADLSADMRQNGSHAAGSRDRAHAADAPADRHGLQDAAAWHAQLAGHARAQEMHIRVQHHMQQQAHTGMPPVSHGDMPDQQRGDARGRMQHQGQQEHPHAYGNPAGPDRCTQDTEQQQSREQVPNINGDGSHAEAWQERESNPASSNFSQNMYSNMLNSSPLGAYGAFMNMCNPYAALQSDPMSAWYATHYGRMACAAAAGAAAATAAAQQRGSFNDNANTSNATRWWQDPQQVFGPAGTAFADADNEEEHPVGQHRSQERVLSGRRPHGSDRAPVGSGPSRGRQQEGSLKRSKEDSLREQEPVPGGSMERREVTGTTDDHDMTDRSPRGQAAKRPRPAPDPASHPPGASAFRRLGSQGAGGMAAVARADSVGSEKSSVVDAGAKREEMDGAAIVKPTATAAHAPAMRTAADILASLSSP